MSTPDAILREKVERVTDHEYKSEKNSLASIEDSLDELANDINSINDEIMHAILLDSIISPQVCEENSLTETSDENEMKKDAYVRQNPIEDYAINIPRSQPITIIHSAIKPNKGKYTGSLENLGRNMSKSVKWIISKSK